jgi:hypothetical protein
MSKRLTNLWVLAMRTRPNNSCTRLFRLINKMGRCAHPASPIAALLILPVILKGQCHEIFDFWVFINRFPLSPGVYH